MKIEDIIKSQLCCGCGTCAGICPKEAIEMKINEKGFYIPKIDKEICSRCGMCDKVCPQINKKKDFIELNKVVFGQIPDKVIGNYTNCYTGYSADKNLRFEASSGGVVTQILISALEEKIINAAIVTRMKKDKPLIPEPFIARTKEEIIEAMGSKYCPVPANIMLREISISKNDEKFAVVGLPCHIAGIRKAEILFPKLKEKIALHVGIFCGAVRSFIGTEFLLKENNVQQKDIVSLKYRGKGWPGYLQIKTRSGKNIILPYTSYYGGLFGMFFKNKACLSCNDYSNEFADISCGDAWGIEKEDSIGTSVIVVRNKNADILLNKFYFEKKIFIKKIDITSLILSKKTITFKKTLPLKNIKIFYPITWRSEDLYSIPFFNFLSTSKNRIIRNMFLEAFNFAILIVHKIGEILKWVRKKRYYCLVQILLP